MPFILKEQDKHTKMDPVDFLAIKAVLQSQAVHRLVTLNPTAITNNTGGTVDGSGLLASVSIPASYTSVATDKAPKAGFDTAALAIWDGQKVIATWLNTIRAQFGLTAIGFTGTPATPGTAAAVTVGLTAVTGGTSCVEDADAKARANSLLSNAMALAQAVNETLRAVGTADSGVLVNQAKNAYTNYTLSTVVATGAGSSGDAVGQESIRNSDAIAVLTKLNNTNATIIARLTAGLTGKTFSNTPLAGVFAG